MPDPAFALLVFFALAVLCAAIFWPGSGIVPRVRRIARLSERVRMEDVLKQLYKLEYDRLPATADSVAGGVQISRNQAIRLLQRLEEKRLVTAGAARFRLTEPGRAQALHIVRTHRLWERFLADRTATPPEDWHMQAETREHLLSAADADDLAAPLSATPSTTPTETRSPPPPERCPPAPACPFPR